LGSSREISKKKCERAGGTRFLTPLFTVWRKRERRAASVPDAIPQWESGRGGHNYSGAFALYTAATRGVLRTAASGLDVRMTSADSALSRYPSRRMDQLFPKPRGEGVRPTATLIAIHSQSRLPLGHSPGCSQPQPHPPCGGCNSTSAWSTTTEVPAKLKSSFLARGWC